jgi:DhnA family fructose-bisphosphate aldolase class Ia
VYRETKRTKDSLAGAGTQVWPGIDVDVPTAGGSSKCTPAGVRDAVLAAYKGGAQGVVLSRSYWEMKAENLRGAGAALEELGLV